MVIITDDQRWDAIHAYGKHEWLQTPNIDKLSADGVMFTKAFCQAPLCSASRTSLFSGRYPHRNGIYGFEYAPADSPYLRPWIPDVLGKHGYKRAHFGKNGAARVIVDPKTNKSSPAGDTFYPDGNTELSKYKRLDNADRGIDKKKYGVITRTSDGGPIIAGAHPRPAGETIDAYIANDAVAFIETLENDESSPTFLNVGFQFPHTPVLVPAPYDTLCDPEDMDTNLLTPEEESKMSEQTKIAVKLFGMHGLTEEQIRKTIAHYYAYNTYGDIHLGRVVDAFKKKSEQQNRPWLIILAADNGWHLGDHGMNAKFTFYDVSAHVPLIVSSSDGRFSGGTKYEEFVEFVDIAPTIMSAAGITVPDYFDGIDLGDLISGNVKPKEFVVSEEFHVLRRAMIRGEYLGREYALSMRTKPDKFNLPDDQNWALSAPLLSLDIHLFDVVEDPYETNNLSGDPSYLPVIMDLKSKLEKKIFVNRIEPRWQDILKQRHQYGDGKQDRLGD